MKLHFIAIGGAIMHQLALVSYQKGNQVTGSDDSITDPSYSNLKGASLLPEELGWFPEKITADIDAVILGMHARADNPELLKAQELGIPVYSFPEYIHRLSKDKKRVVIAGSHGKTTITSMIMHVLKGAGLDFDYLVGAKVEGFPYSVRISDADTIIIEGDEYPASAIDKIPKIHFYQPHISVISGIAWDHVNIFPTYENYWNQFSDYVDRMENDTVVIYNAEDPEVLRLMSGREGLEQIAYVAPDYEVESGAVVLSVGKDKVPLSIFGRHNLQNMEAARIVCNKLGVGNERFYSLIQGFSGAARRLERLQESENFVSFRDFAHAPSKLKATLSATRSHFPDHHLVACFELHTYSSLSAHFLGQYSGAMDDCDASAVFYDVGTLGVKKLPKLDPSAIKLGFGRPDLQVLTEQAGLRSWILKEIDKAGKPVCLLLMSSGTFGGMPLIFNKKK